MKILHVNMSLDPVSGGGTTERTTKLNLALNEFREVEARILTTDAGLDGSNPLTIPPDQAVILPCWNRRWYLPAPYFIKIYRIIAWADIIHLMNHWTLLNAWVYWMARWLKKPYVVCPAGALKIYGRSSVLKRFYNFVVGRSIIKNADALIAITEDEAALFRQEKVPDHKIVHIPNGVWEKDFTCKNENLFREHSKLGKAPFLLYLGRLNSIKGPDILLKAFCQVADKFPELHLVFVGPDGGMQEELKTLIKQEGLSNRVHLIGFAGGDLKSSAYHGAELLVVPSRHEAMSIVALEAGICGTPVLLSDQCGFDALAEAGGGRITPVDIDAMAASLDDLLSNRTELTAMGSRAKNYIAENFSWSIAARNHLNLYKKIIPAEI
ncbi:MAG: glycosyltransferase [Nitrospinota bacterium]|nr:glycosyltransferase [Nitrospinota bacterium]